MDEWIGLTDGEWVNIVNDPRVIDPMMDKEDAVRLAVKFTEDILRAKNANAAPQDQDAKPMVIGYFMRTAENGDSHYFSIPDTLPEGKYEIVLRAAMKEKP